MQGLRIQAAPVPEAAVALRDFFGQAEVRYAATPTDGEVAAQWRVSEVSGAGDLLLVLEVSMWDLEEYTVYLYGSPYTPDYFHRHHRDWGGVRQTQSKAITSVWRLPPPPAHHTPQPTNLHNINPRTSSNVQPL